MKAEIYWTPEFKDFERKFHTKLMLQIIFTGKLFDVRLRLPLQQEYRGLTAGHMCLPKSPKLDNVLGETDVSPMSLWGQDLVKWGFEFRISSAFGDDRLAFGREGDAQTSFKVRLLIHGEGEELHKCWEEDEHFHSRQNLAKTHSGSCNCRDQNEQFNRFHLHAPT